MNFLQQVLAVLVNVCLSCTMAPMEAAGASRPVASRGVQEVYAPVPSKDMDALVAPIALYPDALVAQILGAATYPDQVEAADAFLKDDPGPNRRSSRAGSSG